MAQWMLPGQESACVQREHRDMAMLCKQSLEELRNRGTVNGGPMKLSADVGSSRDENDKFGTSGNWLRLLAA